MTKILLTIIIVCANVYSNAAIVYVNQAATGSNNGTTWNDAYVELVDAINASVSGDELWVAQGTYLPDWNGTAHTGDRTLKLFITRQISVYGGFAGGETARASRDWSIHPTILSGDLNGDDVIAYPTFSNRSDNSAAFLQIQFSINAVIDGIIFSGVNRIPGDPGFSGPIHLIGDINFVNCTFKNNSSNLSFIEEPTSSSLFENCLFYQNRTSIGLLYTHDTGSNLVNCTVVNNHSVSSNIRNASNGMNIRFCNNIFWGNTSDNTSLSIQDIQIGNTANYSSFTNNVVEGWTGVINGIGFPGNFGFNPSFVSSTDFNLQPSSLAIDQGSNGCSSTTLDLDHEARIYNVIIDIGAYEYNAPLPVDLISFEGWKEKKRNKIEWETASEHNCDYFILERSADGINFAGIANIKGAGNSAVAHDYLYYDQNPESGINYYRLKQIDFNGQYQYSQIIAIDNAEIRIVSLYPNPAVDQAEFVLNSNVAENITYELCDVLGRILISKQENVPAGNSLFKINVHELKGIYILRVYSTYGDAHTFKELVVD